MLRVHPPFFSSSFPLFGKFLRIKTKGEMNPCQINILIIDDFVVPEIFFRLPHFSLSFLIKSFMSIIGFPGNDFCVFYVCPVS